MKKPKYYLRIKGGYFMAGLHGYSTRRNATAFMERWIAAMIASGMDEEKAHDAIRVERAS